jgi:hypothetical protein
MSNTRLSRIAPMMALLAPIALVKSLSLVLSAGGPAESEASTDPLTDGTTMVADSGSSEPVPAWTAAAERGSRLREQACGPTPFLVMAAPEASAEPQVVEEEFAFALQMIMGSKDGPVALIDGRPLRVGETVDAAGHWMIKQIDATSRTVIVEDQRTKRSQTVGVEKKKRD